MGLEILLLLGRGAVMSVGAIAARHVIEQVRRRRERRLTETPG